MPSFCTQCGTPNSDQNNRCGVCGTELNQNQSPDQFPTQQEAQLTSQSQPHSSSQSQIQQSRDNGNPQSVERSRSEFADLTPPSSSGSHSISSPLLVPEQREPLWWILGSIFIPFFIYFYAYVNFQDMKKLYQVYHTDSPHNPRDPFAMLILFIIFPPATVYFKFEQLHNHLLDEHEEQPNIPNGQKVIFNTLGGMLVIFGVFLLVVYFNILNMFIASGAVAIAFGIHLASYHYNWQKEFNNHIWKHNQVAQN